MKDLIVEGLQLNAIDANNNTALEYAITGKGDPQVLRLLIGAGADVNVVNRRGETPLSLARRLRRERLTRILKQAGAKR